MAAAATRSLYRVELVRLPALLYGGDGPPTVLTDEQVHEFRTFGFLIFRRFFTVNEMAAFDVEFESVHARVNAAHPFDGTKTHFVLFEPTLAPKIAALHDDPRFCEIAEQLFGDDIIGFAADGFRYVGSTMWHPDTANFDHYGMKFSFYTQPLDVSNGALRIIPGSHRQPMHDEITKYMESDERRIEDVPAFVFETRPGDVLAYDLRLWHASSGGAPDRRSIGLHYFHNPKTPEELAAFHAQDVMIRTHFRELRRAQNDTKAADRALLKNPSLTDAVVAAAERSGGRRGRWLARLGELGFLDRAELRGDDRDWLPHTNDESE